MIVDETAVRAAVKARKASIVENLNTLTLKSCRQTLEADLSLEMGALKPFKHLIRDLIDRIISKQKAAKGQRKVVKEEPPASVKQQQPKKQQKKKKVAIDEEGDDDDDDSEEAAKPSKRQKREGKQPAKASGSRQYSKQVQRLRDIAKAATATIPPSLYVKNKSNQQLQEALEALLEKHGLDASSGQHDILRARSKLQMQRDLDGIDTSNIIEGGRGRRGAAPVSFKGLMQPPSDSEEAEEAAGSSDSEGEAVVLSDSDSDAASEGRRTAKKASKPAEQKKQHAKAAGPESESEEEVASGSEEEVSEEVAGGRTAAEPARGTKSPAAKSPDENLATKSNTGSDSKRSQPATKARLAVSLGDSDGEQAAVPAGKQQALAEWSEDED